MQAMYLKIEQVLLVLRKNIHPPPQFLIIQDLIRSIPAEPMILTVERVTV